MVENRASPRPSLPVSSVVVVVFAVQRVTVVAVHIVDVVAMRDSCVPAPLAMLMLSGRVMLCAFRRSHERSEPYFATLAGFSSAYLTMLCA
jgi:hypothetical protein